MEQDEKTEQPAPVQIPAFQKVGVITNPNEGFMAIVLAGEDDKPQALAQLTERGAKELIVLLQRAYGAVFTAQKRIITLSDN